MGRDYPFLNPDPDFADPETERQIPIQNRDRVSIPNFDPDFGQIPIFCQSPDPDQLYSLSSKPPLFLYSRGAGLSPLSLFSPFKIPKISTDFKNKALNSLLNDIGEKASLTLVQQTILSSFQQHQRISKILSLLVKIIYLSEENVKNILLPNYSIEEIHNIWK